jgi:hypothetical protein
MTSPTKSDRLRLRAEDDEDLAVLSACLQDALVAVRDIVYFPAERRLAMVVNRFRWEGGQERTMGAPGERVLCTVAAEGVRQVRRRGIDQAKPGHLLSILAIRRHEPSEGAATVDVIFAGQAAVRIEMDRLQLRAEDVEEPYPTAWRPRHPLDDPATGAS